MSLPLPSDLRDIPELPTDAQLTYLSEGAANIIYRLSFPTRELSPPPSPTELSSQISLPPGTLTSVPPPHPDLPLPIAAPVYEHRLLRLRKALPSAQPNLTAYAYLSTEAFPLFPPHLLVSTYLLRIPPGVISACNDQLRADEATGRRREKRHGLYLDPAEAFGFLIDDMSPRPERPDEILVEFKPKWVIQSPSAPASWRRCRTCALHASKHHKPGFCPLDLSSQDPARVVRAVEHILGDDLRRGYNSALVERVTKYLVESELMPVLKKLQRKLDTLGPLDTDFGQAFLDAMTVRDLTVFIRVNEDSVEARIADLDMKTAAHGKGEYWRELERELVEGGWYEGLDGGKDGVANWCMS